MDSLRKIAFLGSERVRSLLDILDGLEEDDLRLSRSPHLSRFDAAERIAILEQRELRRRAAAKFSFASRLIFTPRGLEVSTREGIARHKAGRFAGLQGPVADLCCGLGGDSFFLPAAVGVDRDPAVAAAYRFNLRSLGREGAAVCGDAVCSPVRAEAALLDPARRKAGGENRWDMGNLSPGIEDIGRIISRYRNVCLKLGPGMVVPEDWAGEKEYLGVHDDCLELDLWTGALGKPGLVRATEVVSGETLTLPEADIPDSFGRVEDPGAFLFEPVKVVVRAHLFGILAQNLGLWQIDGRTAWLSGNAHLRHPLLKAYRLVEELPFQVRRIRDRLGELGVGKLTLKKRGVALDLDEVMKMLEAEGPREGVVVFTRSAGRKAAFLCEDLSLRG